MFILIWFLAIVLGLSSTTNNGVNAANPHFPVEDPPFWMSPPWMQDEPVVCNTTGCQRTAKRLLDYMDLNANPCEDFYRFACGKFLDTAEMPPYAVLMTAFTATQEALTQQLHTMLSEPAAHDESWPHLAMRRLFDQCMDEDSLDRRGVAPALRVLEEAGGWPVLGRWEENLHFLDIEIRLKKLGVGGNSLIAVEVSQDPRNRSKNIIVVGEAILPLEKEILVQEEDHPIVQAYYDFMVDIAVMLGADRAMAEQDMWGCLHLQIELAKISWLVARDLFNIVQYHTLEEIQNRFPWIDWVKLMKYIFPSDMRPTMEEPTMVARTGTGFYFKLQKILQYTPKRTVANYLLWSVVQTIIPRLTRAMRERHQRFLQMLSEPKSPRWMECIPVASSFSHAISSLYVKRFFNGSSKRVAEEITDYITRQMVNNLKSLDWMDGKTRSEAITKVNSIKRIIGYADEILNNEMLEDYYRKLELNGDYFEALLNFSQWAREITWNKLRKEVKKNDWRELQAITVVNAFYSYRDNSILFPAGILQPPFFSADVPDYATIGTTIGHEIMHGFDNEGSMFDKDGNWKYWWEWESKEQFNKKKQCFIDQYSRFIDDKTGLSVNGELSQGEIIADNGGIKLAYRSWELSRVHYKEEKLPGFEYFDTKQLFMLITANMWCEKYHPKFFNYTMQSSKHPPGKFRVKGIFKNFPEFQRQFKCAKWKQTTEEPCTLW